MRSAIYEYCTLFILIIMIDSLYLYVIKHPFSTMIQTIQQSLVEIKLFSVFICYVLVCTCIYFFIWKKKATYKEAFLLGILVYGIFDSTNYALFHDWNMQLSIIDSLWGGTLFTSSYFFMKLFYLR
jgi:uncharacterized membrane protein